jgi:DNA topoisomerase-1
MRYAQSLYEKGYITYMRTDSTTLSDTAVAARDRSSPNAMAATSSRRASSVRRAKSRMRKKRTRRSVPAGESFKLPEQVARELATTEARVYELIWQRTVASQMTDAVGETVIVRVGGDTRTGRATEFSATGHDHHPRRASVAPTSRTSTTTPIVTATNGACPTW